MENGVQQACLGRVRLHGRLYNTTTSCQYEYLRLNKLRSLSVDSFVEWKVRTALLCARTSSTVSTVSLHIRVSYYLILYSSTV